jgi:hypothetical protein
MLLPLLYAIIHFLSFSHFFFWFSALCWGASVSQCTISPLPDVYLSPLLPRTLYRSLFLSHIWTTTREREEEEKEKKELNRCNSIHIEWRRMQCEKPKKQIFFISLPLLTHTQTDAYTDRHHINFSCTLKFWMPKCHVYKSRVTFGSSEPKVVWRGLHMGLA